MNRSQLQQTLSRLNYNADDENFENYDADNVPAQTKTVEDRTGFRQHIKGAGGSLAGLRAQSVGLLSIKVTRVSINIVTPLPYILFGKNDFDAGYVQTLQTLLVSSVVTITVTSFTVTNVNGNVVFTYVSAGPLTDTITVQLSGNINYISFLSAMAQNFFTFRFMQASISDDTQTSQFTFQTQFGELSALGKQATDSVVLADMIDSSSYRKDKAELIVPEQGVTPSFSYASYIVASAGFSMTHGFFMATRTNFNKLGNR